MDDIRFPRRQFLIGLAGAAVAPCALAQGARPTIATRRLNNIMIAVSDLDRSIAFYENLFGAALRQRDAAVFRLGSGPHFFALVPAGAGSKPGFLSYGITVADFDTGRLTQALNQHGVTNVQVVSREGVPELFIADPDGIRIQLQHETYGRGSGPLGAMPPVQRASSPVLELKTMNHVTLTTSDRMRSAQFYQGIFGLPVQTTQGGGPILAVGTGPENIVIGGGANAGGSNTRPDVGVNHVCFTIENFDPNRVMGILIGKGLQPIEYGNPALIKPQTCRVRLRQRANNGGGPTSPIGTPELYFNDPDNIPIQIQDVKYCGGSGALGQICP